MHGHSAGLRNGSLSKVIKILMRRSGKEEKKKLKIPSKKRFSGSLVSNSSMAVSDLLPSFRLWANGLLWK